VGRPAPEPIYATTLDVLPRRVARGQPQAEVLAQTGRDGNRLGGTGRLVTAHTIVFIRSFLRNRRRA
jgi:hypothetical protein